jgi:hypothetical protein
MPRHLSFLVAPLVWLITALPLGAQTALLNAIPDSALGLVVINNMSDASAKVHKLTEKMKLPVPELLPIVKSFSGAQEGVDEQGSIAGVALASDDEEATWGMSFAAFVPVTDYKAFIKQLDPKDADATITEVTVMGQQYLAAKKGNFAVLCGVEQKEVLEAILASTKSVAGALAPWIAEQQVALVITPAGKKLLFDKINKAFAEAKDLNDDDDKPKEKNADSDGDLGTDARVRAGKQMQRSVKSVLESIEPQLTQVGLGIRIDEQIALHVGVRVLITPEGAIGQWAQNVKPPQGGPLVGLPMDKFVIAYGGASIQLNPEFTKLIDLVSSTGLEMLGLDDELRKQYATIVARHRANQLSTCGLLGPPRPGDSLVSTSLAVEHVKDAKEHLKLTREQFQVLQKGAASDDAKLPTYSVSEVTIGDLKAIELIMDMSAMTKELGAAGPPAGPAEGFMQGLMLRMLGGDGKMRIYFAVADDTHLVSGYSKPLLQRGVEHVRSGKAGLETDAQIAKTSGLLPSGAQWVAYVSPQGLIQWIDTLLRQSLPAEMKFRIPPFPPSDPIGLAAKASASGLDAELVLPESVLAGIGQYVGLVQQMIQGGGAPLP